MSYRQVRDGLEATLSAAIPKANVYRAPADSITAPAVVVSTIKRTGAITFDPSNQLAVTVLLLVSSKNVHDHSLLDDMCEPDGPWSIQAALEANSTLGGAVSDCVVADVEQAGRIEVAGAEYYGAQVAVEVML